MPHLPADVEQAIASLIKFTLKTYPKEQSLAVKFNEAEINGVPVGGWHFEIKKVK